MIGEARPGSVASPRPVIVLLDLESSAAIIIATGSHVCTSDILRFIIRVVRDVTTRISRLTSVPEEFVCAITLTGRVRVRRSQEDHGYKCARKRRQ